MTPCILIGTCGYSYAEWKGPFYPVWMSSNAMLDFFADHFPALELNTTYYRTPGPDMAERMVRRARGRLLFSVKAPGALTHDEDPTSIESFRQFLQPIADAGCLAAVVFQFPESFLPARKSHDLLATIADAFPAVPRVVEFRSNEWLERGIVARLSAVGWTAAIVDQPALAGLSRSLEPTGPQPLAYLRFHGRNAANWRTGDATSRYDYLYSPAELAELAAAVRTAAEGATTTLAFFNNHAQGQAVANALMLAEQLGAPHRRPGAAQGDLFGG